MVKKFSAPIQFAGKERYLRRSHRPWRRILATTDGSPSSLVAVERALDLARSDAAELTVLVVRPAADDGVLRVCGDGPLSEPVSELVARARLRGVSASARVQLGEPGSVILAVAGEIDADVIVAGQRGWPFAEGAGRNTSGYLLRHSDRPVLVVQPWAECGAKHRPSGKPAVWQGG